MSNVSMIDGHIDGPKSTDNEVIKALEKMLDLFRAYEVKTVPIRKDLIMNILSMYEHQNAEIERYKGVIKILENDVATAKSEVIKEFAERLKEQKSVSEYGDYILLFSDIDNLVKEMVGESE